MLACAIDELQTPVPLRKFQCYSDVDCARTTVSKKVAVLATLSAPERKSICNIKVFSGDVDEDLTCLFVTLGQFETQAKAEGSWERPNELEELPLLCDEFAKCLAGMAEQQWTELTGALGPRPLTWPRFKTTVSSFIANKICKEPDVFFAIREHLKQKRLPATMPFKELISSLDLISSHLHWNFDEPQVI